MVFRALLLTAVFLGIASLQNQSAVWYAKAGATGSGQPKRETAEHDFRAEVQSYGENNLNLTAAHTQYVRKLL